MHDTTLTSPNTKPPLIVTRTIWTAGLHIFIEYWSRLDKTLPSHLNLYPPMLSDHVLVDDNDFWGDVNTGKRVKAENQRARVAENLNSKDTPVPRLYLWVNSWYTIAMGRIWYSDEENLRHSKLPQPFWFIAVYQQNLGDTFECRKFPAFLSRGKIICDVWGRERVNPLRVGKGGPHWFPGEERE